MVSMFSCPNNDILADSSGTVYLCEHMTDSAGLIVIPVNAILSLILMFPELQVTGERTILETGKISLMCHAFISLVHMTKDDLIEGDEE